jgi:HlyD family secretion protein
MKPEVRRRVLVITVAVVVVLAMGYGFLPKPVSVDVVTAKRGPLRVTVEEEGRTRVKDRFVVSAPVTGYLRRIDLDAGSVVRKGQRVASLEPLLSSALDPRSRAEAEAAVSSARAALNAAKEKARAAAADAGYTRERSGRMQKLYGEGMIAKDELEQVAAEAEKAEALRSSADAAAAAAQADLERALSAFQYGAAPRDRSSSQTVIVRSPVSGRVLKLHRESEGVVTPAIPHRYREPRNLEVRAEVLSADAVKSGRNAGAL